MKLIGILCWYDESPSWLAATVTSMIHHAQIDHLVAVDGAYALLPNGRGYSGFEQHHVIDEVCRAGEVGLTMFAPREPWFGNEIEKRSYSFKLAETIAEIGEDWYLIMDADDVILNAIGLKETLATAVEDTGECWIVERQDTLASEGLSMLSRKVNMPRETRMTIRKLFRALPRLHVASNHFTFITEAGHVLWNGGPGGQVDAVEVKMDIEHRTHLRDQARKLQQQEYYRRRDELGLERTYVPDDPQTVTM